MKPFIKAILLLSIASSTLTACVSTPVKPVEPTKIALDSTTYVVPASKNIVNKYGFIKDIVFSNESSGPHAARNTLKFFRNSQKKFTVHRRIDNGTAGSGIKYSVDYEIKENDKGYSVVLKPVQYTVYQDGIFSFDIPQFNKHQLQDSIQKGQLVFKFELNSEFKPESIYANFKRLTNKKLVNRSVKHPVTGEYTWTSYNIHNRNTKVNFSMKAVPYRNGSKVSINTVLPAAITSPNTIDFSILEKEIISKFKEVIKS